VSSHEAGALHTPGYGGVATVPNWLRPPADTNELLPMLWSRTVRRDDDGAVRVGGVDVRELAAQHATPAYVLDEADFRSRAVAFRDAFADSFAGGQVYYAGKAFLATAVVRWLVADGLSLDVCSGGELAVALRGGMPPERIALHGNNKSDAELERALTAGVGRIVADSLDELDRIAAIAGRLEVVAPVMLRVTVGVEAHTHEYIATAHEDQKFGLSLADGVAAAAVRRALELPQLRLLGLHAQVAREHGVELPELDLGGGFGIAYTSEHDPLEPAGLAKGLATIVERECASAAVAVPRVSVEPGRAIAGPSTLTLYTVGSVKDVPLDHHAVRRYVAVDGGMSDNIRTALYDADYSCTLASRASQAPAVLARVVGKHCESGDVVVRDEFLPGDVRRGDLVAVPGTGAYCRSMSSQYNHVPRPPVLSVRDGVVSVVIRRETEDDLLGLDVG